MKTKIFSMFLMLTISIGTLLASDEVDGIWYQFYQSSSTAVVTYRGSNYDTYTHEYSGSIVIPASVWYNGKDYNVTSIFMHAFHNCSELTSITIPNSVITIDQCAFQNCTGLTSVTIREGVTSIGKEAFRGCKNLTAIEIPNSVTSIGQDVFTGCAGLPIINNLRYADTYLVGAVYKSLSTYTIKEGTKWIGDNAFFDCENLTSITIPNSITSIGKEAFRGCKSLTAVEIPNSLTSIGSRAFRDCTGLIAIVVDNNNATYDSRNSCNAIIESATNTLKVGCQNTIIPNSVTSIGASAFYGCTGLTSVIIPNSVTEIGTSAFYSCSGLTSVTIPNSVTNIEDQAFRECTSLTSVIIPNSVKRINDYTFQGCTGLTAVEIPNSVTSIGGSAFYGCTGLTSVIIPNSVTIIASEVFRNCTGLTSVIIPNSVTSIGSQIFYGCTSLKSIVIPNSIASIGGSAFGSCTGLTSVTCFATTPPTLKERVWDKVDVSKIHLYVPAESIGAYMTTDQWKDFGSILPISAKETETEDIQTTSTSNSVDITWPAISGAASYELVIKDAGEIKICTLVFDAEGQLISQTFHAPARNNAQQHLLEAGFVFTITGLDPGKEYTYTFTATNNTGNVLRTESGSFYTNGTQDIDAIQAEKSQSTKILHDGQVLILRGDRTYTLQGQEVK